MTHWSTIGVGNADEVENESNELNIEFEHVQYWCFNASHGTPTSNGANASRDRTGPQRRRVPTILSIDSRVSQAVVVRKVRKKEKKARAG